MREKLDSPEFNQTYEWRWVDNSTLEITDRLTSLKERYYIPTEPQRENRQYSQVFDLTTIDTMLYNHKYSYWKTTRFGTHKEHRMIRSDFDNDGWLDLLPGYGQLWPPSPNTLYYEEYDPVNRQFISRTFNHPYPIDPSFSVIDDLDEDGLNEVFVTGVGRGYAGMLFLKSDYPDHYQILNVDTTLFEGAGSTVKTTLIDSKQFICKATSHLDTSLNAIFYYLNIVKWIPSNSFYSVFTSLFHEPESYIHFYEILDMDHDSKENIVYKKVSSYGTHLFDLEKTTISSLNDNPVFSKDFLLLPNYPNPFNPCTTIRFAIPADQQVALNIYALTGEKVNTLLNRFVEQGSHAVTWEGRNSNGTTVSSGIYIYELVTDNQRLVKKMLLVK